ncbi:MAG TPA: hypothetical protein VFU93_02010 [Acidimicrobiales bacterium]|nr:hypothetical protein [Acidimicrobiales bacterium]
MRRGLAALLLVAACGGGGDADATLRDGTHVGSIVELDPTDFDLIFDAPKEDPVEAALDEDLRVRLLDADGELHTVTFEEWRAGFEPDDRSFFGTSRSTYELTVEDGKVVSIDEVGTSS